MKRQLVILLAASVISGGIAHAQDKISDAANNAVQTMGKSLAIEGFSFKNHTIREYVDPTGQSLHIVHNANVVVRRPDHLLVDVAGDDGQSKLDYDGKTLVLYDPDAKKYVSVPFSGSLEDMLKQMSERLNVDFPLADFLTATPDKAFLTGVTSGSEINTVTIDGVQCQHLLFEQPPGIELELWVEKNDRAIPRRLIVTYRSLPGEPRFIAEMSDWKLGLNPSDAEFTFTPPAGATKVEPKENVK